MPWAPCVVSGSPGSTSGTVITEPSARSTTCTVPERRPATNARAPSGVVRIVIGTWPTGAPAKRGEPVGGEGHGLDALPPDVCV